MKLVIKNGKVVGKYSNETNLPEENNGSYDVCYVSDNYTPNYVYETRVEPDTQLERKFISYELNPLVDNDTALKSIRTKREILLSKTDWTVSADAPFTTAEKNAWKAYRQELRDLPDTFANNPADVVWPIPPANK